VVVNQMMQHKRCEEKQEIQGSTQVEAQHQIDTNSGSNVVSQSRKSTVGIVLLVVFLTNILEKVVKCVERLIDQGEE
jgi:hypothetical protein